MAAAQQRTLVRVSNLRKQFGTTVALDDVSFTIQSNETLGLIGPNGSGKTTLFECLGGVLPFDSGTIERVAAGGNDLFYLPDAITPWPAESIDWSQRFVVGLFGGRAHARDAINRRLGLDAILDRPLGTLSKGQRKRAVLALGLLTPHRILLADEPFDGLDLRQTREAASLLREMVGPDRALFLSIHQIADAELVCDRFLLLSDGRVRGQGTVAELSQQSAAPPGSSLEEVFLALA